MVRLLVLFQNIFVAHMGPMAGNTILSAHVQGRTGAIAASQNAGFAPPLSPSTPTSPPRMIRVDRFLPVPAECQFVAY